MENLSVYKAALWTYINRGMTVEYARRCARELCRQVGAPYVILRKSSQTEG